jgi:CRISPR-associated protein Cmr4
MFEAKSLLFYYATTPVHMGAGQAAGAIDNPIQREVHTEHPLIAGSGIKGALRHHLQRQWNGSADWIRRIFGPDSKRDNPSDHAGAISFTDAAVIAFPVRCAKRAFVYATCPTALARLHRMAETALVPCEWKVESPGEDWALASSDAALSGQKLLLEVFDFDAKVSSNVTNISHWLVRYALPANGSSGYFREKIQSDLVVLTDGDFGHFARHATVVEPHVRINNESGTADSGGLFYTECLPPETVLAGLALASIERVKNGNKSEWPAGEILARLLQGADGAPGIDQKLVQFGGDATTGRGLVLLSAAK